MTTIRPATLDDAAACARVYAPYVTDSVISFEATPPTADDMAGRMRVAHEWLVAEVDGDVVGYAYSGKHKDRAAYAWAADVAVYIDATSHRRGIGRALYGELFPLLRERGLRMLCAGVTLPNDKSVGIHLAMGFEPVGIYRKIGWKFGRWHDVAWYQLDLAPGDDGPP